MARYPKTDGFLANGQSRTGRLARAVTLGALLALGATSVVGCRTTTDDIERWSTTAQGPRKLVSVLTHSKYPIELRVEAAMALVRMKPRGGKRVGILGQEDQPGLLGALESLPPIEREKIVSRMVPKLEEEMRKPPPKAQAGQPAPADPSFPFKDAAFALITQSEGSLVASDESRKRLRAALADWCMMNFADRMEESSQLYGTEQVLRELGASGVTKLPEQIVPGAKKIDRMADLIAELGDQKTKTEAGKRLVIVAKDITSDHWIEQKAPLVEAANKASRLNPTKEQFNAQLDQYQEEELLRVFGSMKKLGGVEAADFLIDFAKNDKHEKRRASALAALEGNLDKNNAKHVDTILQIASSKDTPDSVRDVALRRVGDLPRKLVVDKLYGLFSNENWKIRWVAAELVLKMSDQTNLPEFMGKLSGLKYMAITEPLRYGALMSELKGKEKPEDLADRYMSKDNSTPVRLTALGYYYEFGTKSQLSKVEHLTDDKSKVPDCKADQPDCEWKCTVTDGKTQDTKDIKTVGEFAKYCVKPAMEKRESVKKGDTKGK